MAQRAKTSAHKRTLPPIARSLRQAEANQKADAYYRELQTLQDISQTVLTSLDIQTTLERILDKALLVGSFDIGVIRLLDPSGNILQPAAHRGYRDPANVHSKITDPKDEATSMILVQVIAAKGSYQIEDVPRSRGMRSFKKEGVRSAVVVPVRAGEEILGVIQLGSRAARSFHPHEIHLFEAIGSQMGLAVQKARLFEEAKRGERALQAHYRELRFLHEISQTILSSPDLQTILEKVLDQTLSITGLDVGNIRLLEPTGGVALGTYRGYRDPENIDRHHRSTRGVADAGLVVPLVIASRKSRQFEDVWTTEGLRTFKREGVRSAVVVPISTEEEALGVIEAGSRTPRKFQAEEVRLLEAIGNQIGLAMQKARFYEQAEQRLKHAEALREIGLSLTTTHDPQQVLQRVAAEARRLTEALFTFVVTPEKPFYRFAAVAGDDKGYREVLKLSDDPASPYGHGPLGRCIRSRKSVVCEDVLTDPLFKPWREIASERGIRSLVAVPLIVHDQPYGAILTYAPIPRAYDNETMSLLSSLATQAAAALENARLYQESQRQEEVQKLLKELSQEITTLDLESLLKKITDKVREFFKVDICDVRIIEKGVYRVVGASGIESGRIRGTETRRGRSKWIMENRRAIVIPDLTQGTGLAGGETTRRLGIRGYLAVPLFFRGGEVVGVLRALTYQPRDFTQAEVDLVQQLANGAAIAIENTRLFEETKGSLERIRLLREIDTAIASTLDLHALLDLLLEKIDSALPYVTATTVRLLDSDTGQLEPMACRNLDVGEWKASAGTSSRGPGNWVLEKRAPLVVRNVQADSRILDREFFRKYGLLSYVGVPLIVEDEVIGVIGFYTREEREFTGEELEFLSTLAGQAAIAIHKCQLYEEARTREAQLQETNRMLSALHEVATAAAESLDLDRIFRLAIEKITEMFSFDATRIHIYDERTDKLDLRASFDNDPDRFTEARSFARGQGIVGKVAESGKALIFEDIETDPIYQSTSRTKVTGQSGYHFFAVFPIRGKLKTLGTLGCVGTAPRKLSAGETQLLEAIADRMAAAMENSELYEQLRQKVKELQQKTVELEDANKVKDEFLSVMSHELRTPLTSLVGYMAMMQDKILGEINREQERALEKMAGGAKALLTMIETIMEATKIETGAIVVERHAANLTETLDSLRLSYDRSVGKEITLIWDYPDDLPSINTDPAKLKQILQHLINNALKFTERGGVTVSARLIEGNRQQEIGDRKKEPSNSTHASRLTPLALFECVEFKVADTGIGIPKEVIPLIFEKFRQIDSSETRVHGGVGLGLYIVKKFTELLGGEIEVQSEPGKGSTFTVTIPYGDYPSRGAFVDAGLK